MKIVLQQPDCSRFVWETPKIVDEAQIGIERWWRENMPECADEEARRLISEIEQKIRMTLWIITAGCALGGREGCLVFNLLDETLGEIKDVTLRVGERKFGT